MRIVIANPTSGGISGGYKKYLNRVVPELVGHSSVSAMKVLVPVGVIGQLRSDVPIESVGDRSWPSAIAEFRADVVLIPTARIIDTGGVPVVVMMRNMEPVTVPFAGNTLSESMRNVARAAVAFHACHAADHVIAVSAHVARFLVSRWRIPKHRLCIIPHGVDPPSPSREWKRPTGVAVGARFLFTAGSIRPSRGLDAALEAFALVATEFGDRRLTIAGQATPDAQRHATRLRALAETLNISDRVDWVGSLDADAMAWCYGNADAFVMTSRAEACPNIALEALSHGCLVISTPRAPMPEFFGDAAVYAQHPHDSVSLADAIRRVLRAPDRFDEMKSAAMNRALQYTWDLTARRTVAELERVVSQRRERAGMA